MTHPSVDDVDCIARSVDPVLRNLQITQCYHEISRAMQLYTGAAANWCTYASWASKQAGQTIRGEDVVRHFQDHFRGSPAIAAAIGAIAEAAGRLGFRWQAPAILEKTLAVLNPAAAFARASDAVARGNRKVFEEIGREFARFLTAFAEDTSFDAQKISLFCAELRPGEPPDGQQLLRDAFAGYCEARFVSNPDARSELLFFANLLAGYHEQLRLQPEIAEALNASINAEEVKRSILQFLLPRFWIRFRYQVARLLGRKLPLDKAIDRLLKEARRQIRETITHHLMTLHLSDQILRLGSDLRGSFPQLLTQIVNTKLKELLARIDPTPDSISESGARDWAHFDDRMHFITDFFRCYHESSALLDPPFTAKQALELKAGRRPPGPL